MSYCAIYGYFRIWNRCFNAFKMKDEATLQIILIKNLFYVYNSYAERCLYDYRLLKKSPVSSHPVVVLPCYLPPSYIFTR